MFFDYDSAESEKNLHNSINLLKQRGKKKGFGIIEIDGCFVCTIFKNKDEKNSWNWRK